MTADKSRSAGLFERARRFLPGGVRRNDEKQLRGKAGIP